MKNVTIFILNYNGIDAIKAGSLDSIKAASNQLKEYDVSYLFLDNFSNDGSVEYVKRSLPNATIASTFQNEGYVRGTNIGIKLSWKIYHPDYIFLVDSDNFCDTDAYIELLKYAETHENAAMIQPMIKSYEQKNIILSCGHTFNAQGGTDSIKDPLGNIDISHLESCSISSTLFRTSVLNEVGLLNEAFEMYYESSDISFRIREKGYDCACCHTAIAYNERLSQNRLKDFRKYYLMRRNLFLFWFLHDSERYDYYLDYWKERFIKYQNTYNEQMFIIDHEMEAERRGIYEGYELRKHNRSEFLIIPALEDFDKNDVLIIQRK